MTVFGLASLTPRARLAAAHRILGSLAELSELMPTLFPQRFPTEACR